MPSATPTATAVPATATATPLATPTPAPKRYDRLDATGEAATAGSWAILGADGGVLTTWEGLRGEAATLRLHQTDAGGASQAAAYGSVAEGDIIEWRKADDCWVRYRVTAAPTRPASGSSRWEFPVEWITYAATGAGCTGAVGAATVLRVDEDAPAIRASGITSPVRHGPYLIAPASWTGGAGTVEGLTPPGGWPETVRAAYTSDLAEARRIFSYWSDPVLPAGWTFMDAESGTDESPGVGYCADYLNAGGYYGVMICASYKSYRPHYQRAVDSGGAVVHEPRMIDGRPALVRYSPQGPAHDQYLSILVWVFDTGTGVEYLVWGYDGSLRGGNPDPAIAIARSLLPAASAP